MRLTAGSRWHRTVAALALTAAGVASGLLAVSGVVAVGPASAAPLEHVPALTGLPQTLAGHHFQQVLPLASGKPVPANWPRPGEALQPAASPYPTAPGAPKPYKSTNWSGYADTGKGAVFTAVSGSWSVPGISPSASAYSASWIGIDGFNNNELIQTGTEQDWDSDGDVYFSWYELIPAAPVYLGEVFPGDKITAVINRVGASTWEVKIADLTRGVVWEGAVSYTSPGTSAEWIQEAPFDAVTNRVLGLANYGSVTFSDLGVSGPGTQSATMKPIYMYTKKHGVIRSYPDQYKTGNDSFDVYFGNSGAATGYPEVPVGGVPQTTTSLPSTTTTTSPAVRPTAPGYWLLGLDGGVFSYGSAGFYGSAAKIESGKGQYEVTSMAATPDGRGYWVVNAEGGIFPYGDARYYGSIASMNSVEPPVIQVTATADGRGYYMVGLDGSVFAFGDAHYYGSCQTIGGCGVFEVTSLLPDTTGGGYWILTENCNLVSFGDAPLISSFGCESRSVATREIARSAAPTPDGKGFWVLLTSNKSSQIYTEGDASSYGNWTNQLVPHKNNPAMALLLTPDGRGAWVVFEKGQVEDLGDAPDLGSLNGVNLHAPIFTAATP
ncbi:MAG TPA: G1 family glutamic endopeptidase [Acidimicrobiales bacterium]|nr:G1 family glutamic endopeptidase [Acidimicrobiales bacterium]